MGYITAGTGDERTRRTLGRAEYPHKTEPGIPAAKSRMMRATKGAVREDAALEYASGMRLCEVHATLHEVNSASM